MNPAGCSSIPHLIASLLVIDHHGDVRELLAHHCRLTLAA